MSERGVAICPACGCQFSDHGKVDLERQVQKYRTHERRWAWLSRPRYQWRLRRIKHKVERFDEEARDRG